MKLLYCWATYCCFLGLASGQETPAAIAANLKAVTQLPPIKFTATTYTQFAVDFHKANPKLAKFDNLTFTYKGVLAGNEYCIETLMHMEKARPFLATFDGTQYCSLTKNSSSIMMVSKDAPTASCPEDPLGALILAPYEFLFPVTDYSNYIPYIFPGCIDKLIDQTWIDRLNHSADISTPQNSPDLFQRRFDWKDGAYYLVTFSKKDKCFPVAFEQYGADKKILQKYRVTEVNYLDTPHGSVPFQKKAILEQFINGWPRSTVTITIDHLELISIAADQSMFEIDPAEAAIIYDADHGVQIGIPR